MPDNPKRKYTVTEKVLAACRANLLKANAVAKAIRYRSTEPRLLACRANLTLAIAARRADWSAGYAPSFRLGVYAISLRRSLAAAGESEAEFDAHLELFARAFAPADAVEQKLVRAMAKVWWRRLRALRLQSRWETNEVRARLLRAASVAEPMGRVRDLGAALAVSDFFLKEPALSSKLGRLNQRFERLARVLAERRGYSDTQLRLWLRRHASESLMTGRLEVLLENPFLAPGELERRIHAEVRQPVVREVKSWTWRTPDSASFNANDEFAPSGSGFEMGFKMGSGKSVEASVEASAERGAPEEASVAPADPPTAASEFAAHLQRIARAFPEPPDQDSSSRAELRKLAALTWARQGVYGAAADREVAFLKEILGEPGIAIEARTATLLTRLDHDVSLWTAIEWLSDSVSHAFYELLVKRYGENARAECFKVEWRGVAWDKDANKFLEAMDEAEKSATSA